MSCKAENIYYLVLYRKGSLTPILLDYFVFLFICILDINNLFELAPPSHAPSSAILSMPSFYFPGALVYALLEAKCFSTSCHVSITFGMYHLTLSPSQILAAKSI